jgi:hypothetical protein
MDFAGGASHGRDPRIATNESITAPKRAHAKELTQARYDALRTPSKPPRGQRAKRRIRHSLMRSVSDQRRKRIRTRERGSVQASRPTKAARELQTEAISRRGAIAHRRCSRDTQRRAAPQKRGRSPPRARTAGANPQEKYPTGNHPALSRNAQASPHQTGGRGC